MWLSATLTDLPRIIQVKILLNEINAREILNAVHDAVTSNAHVTSPTIVFLFIYLFLLNYFRLSGLHLFISRP